MISIIKIDRINKALVELEKRGLITFCIDKKNGLETVFNLKATELCWELILKQLDNIEQYNKDLTYKEIILQTLIHAILETGPSEYEKLQYCAEALNNITGMKKFEIKNIKN